MRLRLLCRTRHRQLGTKQGAKDIGGAFFIALVVVAVVGFGGRDQRIVAAVADRLGATVPLLAVAIACSVGTSLLAALAGGFIGATMSDSAETMLVAIALAFAALELGWWKAVRAPAEPTRSLGALTLVLAARQVGDAPRLVVFALAAGSGAELWSGIGGALGASVGAVGAVYLGHEKLVALPLAPIRLIFSGLIGVAAVVIALSARGLVG